MRSPLNPPGFIVQFTSSSISPHPYELLIQDVESFHSFLSLDHLVLQLIHVCFYFY